MSYSHASPLLGEALPAPAPVTKWWEWLLVVGALAFVWFEAVNHLRAEWSVNPQYEYGWLVPFLACYLFWRRWEDQPTAARSFDRRFSWLVAMAALFVLLPARIISVANPDWRLLSWAFSLATVTVTLCLFYQYGGKSWCRHFAFPAVFLLVACPWPVRLEQFAVHALMRADTAVVVKLLTMVGTPALQRGNVIELPTGLVGIADACTGIRSLQSTLMTSLFLGEFYRLTVRRRIALVLTAAILAFVCNLGRTLLLCLIASHQSLAAMHGWHDSAGLSILIISVIGLWLISAGMARPKAGALPDHEQQMPLALTNLIPLASVIVIWLSLTEIGTALWYRGAEETAADPTGWSIAWPTKEKSFTEVTIPEAARDLLSYDDGGGGEWKTPDHRQWLMYYFHWLPGRTAARFVKFHRPDICLPASGMTMTADSGFNVVKANGIPVPIRSYRFDKDGTPLDVFYCYADARSSARGENSAAPEDWTARGRLDAVFRRERERGAQMLELVGWGYPTHDDAATAVQHQMENLLRPR